eukprot:3146183-Rhodomonas_salina.1
MLLSGGSGQRQRTGQSAIGLRVPIAISLCHCYELSGTEWARWGTSGVCTGGAVQELCAAHGPLPQQPPLARSAGHDPGGSRRQRPRGKAP